MDKSFKVRVSVGLGMFAVALLGLYTFDSIPFKIIFGIFVAMSIIELLSFFHQKFTITNAILAIIEIGFLVGGAIFVGKVDLSHFWYIILGVCGYDIFAYFSGKLVGGKLIKKHRPFPKISKNKTWEGTVLGLAISIGITAIYMATQNGFATDWYYLLASPLALVGDLYESYLKRRLKIKDSGEIVIKNKTFAWLEMLIGGSEGHGGYLDRIDSTAFASTILLLFSILL